MTAPKHQIERIRHDIRRRQLTVTQVSDLSPRMRRIVFASPDLADFVSAGVDDHIKLFFTDADGNQAMRDFTPRAFDTAAQTLTIDFALHDAGPANDWARAAQVGAALDIGGPRGSMVVPDDFDWYLLIADETGLPSIGRRLEALRAGVQVTTIVAIDDAGDQQDIATQTDWSAHWVRRDQTAGTDADRLLAALAALEWPAGEGYVWIAAEAHVAKALRAAVLERGHPAAWMRAAGYWQSGEPGAHENFG